MFSFVLVLFSSIDSRLLTCIFFYIEIKVDVVSAGSLQKLDITRESQQLMWQCRSSISLEKQVYVPGKQPGPV